jgi:anti-sigma regulatory factor (Ser/Thr protein kinase)
MSTADSSFPAAERGSRALDCWPLYACLELDALPIAVCSGRLHAKHLLREWGLAGSVNSVQLVVSELVTNAIQASANVAARDRASGMAAAMAPIRMRLASDWQRILIEVWDSDPRAPQHVTPDPDAENGRGLLLVEALSSSWHWYFPHGWHGKVVWADLKVE